MLLNFVAFLVKIYLGLTYPKSVVLRMLFEFFLLISIVIKDYIGINNLIFMFYKSE